jgi:hypothetical protein
VPDDLNDDIDLIFGELPDAPPRRAQLAAELAAALDENRQPGDEDLSKFTGDEQALPEALRLRLHAALAASPAAREDLESARELVARVEASPSRAPDALIARARSLMPANQRPSALQSLLAGFRSAPRTSLGLGLAVACAVLFVVVILPGGQSRIATTTTTRTTGVAAPTASPAVPSLGAPNDGSQSTLMASNTVTAGPAAPATSSSPQTSAPTAAGDWVALATSPSDGAVGSATRQPGFAAAMQAALAACTANGGSECRLQLSGEAACLAVAQRQPHAAAFGGEGPDDATARRKAQSQCEAAGAAPGDCQVAVRCD